MLRSHAHTLAHNHATKFGSCRRVCGGHSAQFPTGLPNACGGLFWPAALPDNTGERVHDCSALASACTAPGIHTLVPAGQYQGREGAEALAFAGGIRDGSCALPRRSIAPDRRHTMPRCRAAAAQRDQSFRRLDLQVRSSHDKQKFL